jgi:hypothetical protein
MQPTLRQALIQLFPDADPSTFEDVDVPVAPDTGQGTDDGDVDATYESLVNQAIAKIKEAEDSLRSGGDLGNYQSLVREAQDLLNEAEALRASGASGGSGGSTPSTTAPASPDTTVPESTTSTTAPASPTQASLRYWAAARR